MLRAIASCAAVCALVCSTAQAQIPVNPEVAGFSNSTLDRLRAAVDDAIKREEIPGAVLLVGRRETIALRYAAGFRAVDPRREPMTTDTVFDLASLTKPIATATAIMLLVDQGKLRIADQVASILPEFDHGAMATITLEHLLRHRSGLIADNPLADYAEGPETAWLQISKLEPLEPPGRRFLYSDVNYLILGRIVERVAGQPLDAFCDKHIFDPLEMRETGFWSAADRRPAGFDANRFAPTEMADGAILRGVVHDPRARALGGVAGHAGLFSTADDLAKYAMMILHAANNRPPSLVLSHIHARQMIDPADTPARERRGLGWDIDTPQSTPRGTRFGSHSFGHTGFTGTSLWIDPDSGVFVIVLTSRLHPDGKRPSPARLRSEVATLAAECT
jgi:CubicO group peptidase (beta-lactamase class C family)